MKIYLKENVWDAALRRIRWLFDEFPEIVVGVSGGKDSTVVFNLSLMVAREKKRLPLKVMFLDQEAEWQATVDQVRLIMTNPDVKPFWYQIPFKLFNATSATDHWLMCWDDSKKDLWMHPKEAYSLKENHYGTDRFADMFTQILAKDFPAKTVYIAGVRCEESPSRFIGLTQAVTYKGETWGKILSRPRQQFTFYPIYDWSFSDVWKAIHDNGWHYNALYDSMFQYGVNLREIPDAAIGLQPFFQDFSIESFLAGVTAPVHTDGDIAERGKQNDANIASFGKANGNLVTVTCPHCAEQFQLDKEELARWSNLVDVPKDQQPVQPKNKWGADAEPAEPVKKKGKK